MKLSKNSLKVKVLIYLLVFSILILIFLWIFQVASLKKYYETSVKREIVTVTKNIKTNYDNQDYEEIFDIISHDQDMCIEIYNNNYLEFSSVSCNSIASDSLSIKYKSKFVNSGYDERGYQFTDQRFNTKILMYGIKLENERYAFISVALEPVDATVNILQKQFTYIALIVFSLSVIVAYFISKKISRPIESINEKAKMLAKGDYETIGASKENIEEINELIKTLNYTGVELAKTEELRREFMANVSHDLKTPLTMIKAYAEMVKDLTYKNKEKREDNLNVIMKEVDRLNLLVNDILDLSKIQSGTYSLELEEFDLNKFLNSIIKSYDIYKISDGYIFEYEETEEEIVFADKKRIEQVIRNLINNALNYTGEDKKVIIRTKKEEDYVLVQITDTGKGITEDEIDLIWDKYYKSDKTHSRIAIGTGIGLSIVKSILVAHNFEYGVISKKDEGTTFYFKIKSKENK